MVVEDMQKGHFFHPLLDSQGFDEDALGKRVHFVADLLTPSAVGGRLDIGDDHVVSNNFDELDNFIGSDRVVAEFQSVVQENLAVLQGHLYLLLQVDLE